MSRKNGKEEDCDCKVGRAGENRYLPLRLYISRTCTPDLMP